MESHPRDIKDVASSLVAINFPLTEQELIQYTAEGLNDDYEQFITAETYFGAVSLVDELRTIWG